MLDAQYSMLNVQGSMFNAQCSTLNVQCSMLKEVNILISNKTYNYDTRTKIFKEDRFEGEGYY